VASVAHRVTEDGTHQIGVKTNGVFVPFVSLAAYRVAQLVEAAENTAETEDETETETETKAKA